MKTEGSVPQALAAVLLLATVYRLPRTVALSPEELAGLQGLCELNLGPNVMDCRERSMLAFACALAVESC